MYYELYVDSLFLVNFVMNLYLLILVNRSTLRTATRRGVILGAGVGALVYLMPFAVEWPVWMKFPMALVLGAGLMIGIAFRPRSIQAFLKILRTLFWYSFLMGGLLLFADGLVPGAGYWLTGIAGVLGVGALGCLLVGYCQEVERRRKGNPMCRATLIQGETRCSVSALLDSGNSLREPISGKPVAIIDADLYRALWDGRQRPYRAIPYHSIGRKSGILKGYLLPALEVEIDGIVKCFQDVYVAVSEEKNGVRMILNPALLDDMQSSGRRAVNAAKKDLEQTGNGELR
jgi:stage II sporulation protein GA (sporulation sigma-E factor processing peptidase)